MMKIVFQRLFGYELNLKTLSKKSETKTDLIVKDFAKPSAFGVISDIFHVVLGKRE